MRRIVLPCAAAALAATHATPACASTLPEGFTGSFLLTFFFFVSIVAVAQFVHWFRSLFRGKTAGSADEDGTRERAENSA